MKENKNKAVGPLADVANWGNLALLESCHAQTVKHSNPRARFGQKGIQLSREEIARAERIQKQTLAWHDRNGF